MTIDLAAPTQHPNPLPGLPAWSAVLAVVAHPDDESFGLGAVLDALARRGVDVSVLCLTRGEASTIQGVSGDLATLRAAELQLAATALGVRGAELRGYADGALAGVPAAELAAEVVAAAGSSGVQALLTFDTTGVSGHPDHAAATAAALEAATTLDLPVLGWTVPRAVADTLNEEFGTGFVGHEPAEVDVVLDVDRERQRIASLAHASQAVPSSVLWRRLELLGDREHLRWLRRRQAPAPASTTGAAGSEPAMLRVDHVTGDRFVIGIRDHVITVDQPVDAGGDDLGPTPTELFVAGLASCVAFYARRYLRRHKYDATGLVVETGYRMGTKPARVTEITMAIRLPYELPRNRREGLLAMASHCTVHNSITNTPDMAVTLVDGPRAAPAA